MAAGPSVKEALEFVSAVWGTWQAKAGTAMTVLTLVGAVCNWVAGAKAKKRHEDRSSGLSRTVRLGAVISVAVLVAAPYGLWRQQREDLTATRDSLRMATQELDSMKSDVGRLNARTAAYRAIAARVMDSSTRRRVAERLGAFVKEADSLATNPGPGMWVDPEVYRAWAGRVAGYLLTCGLDRTYEVEFSGAASGQSAMSYGSDSPMSDAMGRQRRTLLKFIDLLRERR